VFKNHIIANFPPSVPVTEVSSHFLWPTVYMKLAIMLTYALLWVGSSRFNTALSTVGIVPSHTEIAAGTWSKLKCVRREL